MMSYLKGIAWIQLSRMTEKLQQQPRIRRLKLILLVIVVIGITLYACKDAIFHVSPNSPNFTKELCRLKCAPPSNLDSIFLIETTGNATISAHQACIVESAARANSKMNVILYLTSEVISKSDPRTKILLRYKNVQIRNITSLAAFSNLLDLESLFIEITSKKMDQFWFRYLLRFLVLWEYGGIYLDLDMLVTNSLNKLRNCIGRKPDGSLSDSVIAFEKNHPFILQYLNLFVRKYHPDTSAFDSSRLLREILENKCSITTYTLLLSNEICGDVAIIPRHKFYPIPWWEKEMLFTPNQVSKVRRLLSKSYTTHYEEVNKSVASGVDYVYEVIDKIYCPLVHELN